MEFINEEEDFKRMEREIEQKSGKRKSKNKIMAKKKFWKKILSSNEEIKYEFSIGNTYLKIGLKVVCLSGVLLFFFNFWFSIIFILIFGFYYGWYLKEANKYAFTNKRVLIHKGWLSTNLISVDYDKITDIEVQEPFLDRVFYKTGSLLVNTAGTTLREIVLEHIENPYEIKKKLDELR